MHKLITNSPSAQTVPDTQQAWVQCKHINARAHLKFEDLQGNTAKTRYENATWLIVALMTLLHRCIPESALLAVAKRCSVVPPCLAIAAADTKFNKPSVKLMAHTYKKRERRADHRGVHTPGIAVQMRTDFASACNLQPLQMLEYAIRTINEHSITQWLTWRLADLIIRCWRRYTRGRTCRRPIVLLCCWSCTFLLYCGVHRRRRRAASCTLMAAASKSYCRCSEIYKIHTGRIADTD